MSQGIRRKYQQVYLAVPNQTFSCVNRIRCILLWMVTIQWRIQDFPEGGANPLRGAPTYHLTNFSSKLHENKEILGWGACIPRGPPPQIHHWMVLPGLGVPGSKLFHFHAVLGKSGQSNRLAPPSFWFAPPPLGMHASLATSLRNCLLFKRSCDFMSIISTTFVPPFNRYPLLWPKFCGKNRWPL